MVDLFIFFVFIFFVFFGVTRPHVAFSGYIWVDIFNPQQISFGFLSTVPMSFSMALVCLVSLVLSFKKLKKPADFKIVIVLVLFILWVTLTTIFSYFPIHAWFKWDVVFKTLVMTLIFFFVINKKEQLELCFIVFTLSASYFLVTAGAKIMTGGGGYGSNLITGAGNSGLAESSTLSMVAIMLIPMVLFLKRNTILFEGLKDKKILWLLPHIFILATVVGTQARTGFVALIVFLGLKISVSANKVRNIFLICTLASFAYTFILSDDWKDRMNTITNASEDSSASGRMLVWQWTLDFAKTHPLGGGFKAFIANAGQWQLYSDKPIEDEGSKAFHSIYFEVLGEHGYIGLALFLLLIFLSWRSNMQVIKRGKGNANMQWHCECGQMLNHSLIIFCVSGAFIGVAFQPILYYYVAFSVILKKIEQESYA